MKYILALCCLFAGTVFLCAQSKFGGGIGAGFTINQVYGDDFSGFNKPGAMAGVFGNYTINDRNWLQMEINFVQKGSYQAPTENFQHKYSLNLNYIEIPVLYKFMPVGRKFTFEIGPAFGLLINSTEKNELGDIKQQSGPNYIEFKRFELAGIAGINYSLGKGFVANFRVMQSVMPVRNHQGNSTYWLNRGQYNTSLCLSLRYQFQPKTESTN